MSSADAAAEMTISGALKSLTGDLLRLKAELGSELKGKDISCFEAPDTLTQAYSDAQAAQQALAEQGGGKKRRLLDEALEGTKKWAKPPGESLVDPDVAPFLAYNEEYFRYITPEDVDSLVPEGSRRPEDEPDFHIPALGRYYVLGASTSRREQGSRLRLSPALFHSSCSAVTAFERSSLGVASWMPQHIRESIARIVATSLASFLHPALSTTSCVDPDDPQRMHR